jgi:hypothetical protein
MNNLDKSWEEKSKKFDNSLSSISEAIWMPKGYMEGSSDFQKKAIKEIENYRNGFIVNSVTYKRLNNVINLIKNLKAE